MKNEFYRKRLALRLTKRKSPENATGSRSHIFFCLPLIGWLETGLLMLIRLYQLIISPALSPSCRFYPTCSVYAHEAIERHGLFKGSYLALRRLARCHPFSGGGYDPVP